MGDRRADRRCSTVALVARVTLAALVLAAALLTAPSVQGARSALFFFFQPTAAKPGDRVTVRTAPTPVTFGAGQRVGPLGRPYRLYLVRNDAGEKIRSRLDPRLHFVGSLIPDARGRGTLTFTVPPLDSGSYAAAVWCPSCARYSRGRTFFVLGVGAKTVTRYRSLMLLRVTAPGASAETCPVTLPNGSVPPGFRPSPQFHGNGALWTRLQPDGAFVSRNADGSHFVKMIWGANGVDGKFSVRYQRLDVPATTIAAETIRGTWHGFEGTASWASRMYFSEGCWRVTGRVRDVSLSFVVQVVRPPGA
jgi:hypothetical protein